MGPVISFPFDGVVGHCRMPIKFVPKLLKFCWHGKILLCILVSKIGIFKKSGKQLVWQQDASWMDASFVWNLTCERHGQ
jgi:hypothetical protein